MQDLTQLSDPDFMAEAEALRAELEHQGDRTNLADLKRRYDEFATEFDRRVGKARTP